MSTLLYTIESLTAKLQDPLPEIRRWALQRLIELYPDKAVSELEPAIQDEVPDIQALAIHFASTKPTRVQFEHRFLDWYPLATGTTAGALARALARYGSQQLFEAAQIKFKEARLNSGAEIQGVWEAAAILKSEAAYEILKHFQALLLGRGVLQSYPNLLNSLLAFRKGEDVTGAVRTMAALALENGPYRELVNPLLKGTFANLAFRYITRDRRNGEVMAPIIELGKFNTPDGFPADWVEKLNAALEEDNTGQIFDTVRPLAGILLQQELGDTGEAGFSGRAVTYQALALAALFAFLNEEATWKKAPQEARGDAAFLMIALLVALLDPQTEDLDRYSDLSRLSTSRVVRAFCQSGLNGYQTWDLWEYLIQQAPTEEVVAAAKELLTSSDAPEAFAPAAIKLLADLRVSEHEVVWERCKKDDFPYLATSITSYVTRLGDSAAEFFLARFLELEEFFQPLMLDALSHYPTAAMVAAVKEHFREYARKDYHACATTLYNLGDPSLIEVAGPYFSPLENAYHRASLLLNGLKGDTEKVEETKGWIQAFQDRMEVIYRTLDGEEGGEPYTVVLPLMCPKCQAVFHYEVHEIWIDDYYFTEKGSKGPMAFFLRETYPCPSCGNKEVGLVTEAAEEIVYSELLMLTQLAHEKRKYPGPLRTYPYIPTKEGRLNPWEGIEYFRKRLLIDPKNIAVHAGLGELLGFLQKYEEALGELQHALSLDPDCLPVYSLIAQTFYFMHDAKQALHFQLKALNRLDTGYFFDENSELQIQELYERGHLYAKMANSTAMQEFAAKHPLAAAGRQKVGRNDPCPCGSRKKYKHCCGKA